MEKHQGFKALGMVERVGGPIVELGLGHPKLWWDSLVHDPRGEGRLCAELRLKGAGRSNLEGLELTAHIIDLVGEVGSSQFGGRKELAEVRGLRRKSWASRATRF